MSCFEQLSPPHSSTATRRERRTGRKESPVATKGSGPVIRGKAACEKLKEGGGGRGGG